MYVLYVFSLHLLSSIEPLSLTEKGTKHMRHDHVFLLVGDEWIVSFSDKPADWPTLYNSHWSPAASPTGVSGKTPHLSKLLAEWRLELAGWIAQCRARWRSPTLPGVEERDKSGRETEIIDRLMHINLLYYYVKQLQCVTFPEVFTPFQRLKYTMVKMRKRQSINCQRTPPTFLSPDDLCISRTFLL